jgi:hypothetical protein
MNLHYLPSAIARTTPQEKLAVDQSVMMIQKVAQDLCASFVYVCKNVGGDAGVPRLSILFRDSDNNHIRRFSLSKLQDYAISLTN